MNLYSKAKVSPTGKVNKNDLQKWVRNLLVFLIPLVVVYLLQLSGVLQNKALEIKDLIPSQATQGAIELYAVNAVLDLLRKFRDGKK